MQKPTDDFVVETSPGSCYNTDITDGQIKYWKPKPIMKPAASVLVETEEENYADFSNVCVDTATGCHV